VIDFCLIGAGSYRRELDLFVQALETGRASDRVEDGKRALMIAEAGVLSVGNGMPVAPHAESLQRKNEK
jgi:hypothetical protein